MRGACGVQGSVAAMLYDVDSLKYLKHTDKDLYDRVREVISCQDYDGKNIPQSGGAIRRSNLANKVATVAKDRGLPERFFKTMLRYA